MQGYYQHYSEDQWIGLHWLERHPNWDICANFF